MPKRKLTREERRAYIAGKDAGKKEAQKGMKKAATKKKKK